MLTNLFIFFFVVVRHTNISHGVKNKIRVRAEDIRENFFYFPTLFHYILSFFSPLGPERAIFLHSLTRSLFLIVSRWRRSERGEKETKMALDQFRALFKVSPEPASIKSASYEYSLPTPFYSVTSRISVVSFIRTPAKRKR